jgi:uncharacterized HhH-GPD family protein
MGSSVGNQHFCPSSSCGRSVLDGLRCWKSTLLSIQFGRWGCAVKGTLYVTGKPEADDLLNSDPFALILGMLLDQQIPMEIAFNGPSKLVSRLGHPATAAELAAMSADEVVALFSIVPALHRFPASMGKRAHEMCTHLVEYYDGDVTKIWKRTKDAGVVLQRLRAIPGFGEEKSQIFLALLAKRFKIRPDGWEVAAGVFSDTEPRSIADSHSAKSFATVRVFKKAMKEAKRDKQGRPDATAAKTARCAK